MTGIGRATTERCRWVFFALALGGCASRAPEPSGPPPDIVLISIDTLRADALGCYGYPRATSPRIDELAAGSFLFERAYTHSPNTIVAHASLFTSLHPVAHGVRRDQPLPEASTTLAESLQVAGYITAGFTTHGDWLNRDKGFAQGFDHFEARYRNAMESNRRIRRWLRSESFQASRATGAPVFLFVHYYDVHSDWRKLPYDTRSEFDRRFASEPPGEFTGCRDGVCASELLRRANSAPHLLTPEEKDWVRALYDGGVAYTDHHVGRLFDLLAEHDLFADSWVIVTSDHGEEFAEHGRFLHSQPYEETARIPLLIRPPAGSPGHRIDVPVGIVDLMPTLLELAGLPEPGGLEGRSLASFLANRPLPPHPQFFTDYADPEIVSVRTDGLTLVTRSRGGIELYRDSDRTQTENIAQTETEHASRLARLAREFHHTQLENRRRLEDRDTEISDEELDRLRSLGYVE